jgi:TonB family protein
VLSQTSRRGIRLAAGLFALTVISETTALCAAAAAQDLRDPDAITIGLELGLPNGANPQLTVANGETGTILVEDVGTFGFVPRLRSGTVVQIEVLDMRMCPSQRLGGIDVVAMTEMLETPTSPAFRVRVTSISGSGIDPRRGLPLRAETEVPLPAQVTRVEPVYPSNTAVTSATGMVLVQLLISVTGDVLDARVLASVSDRALQAIPEFEQPALDAVRRWKFAPTMYNGEPREMLMTVKLPFAPPSPDTPAAPTGSIERVPGSAAPGQIRLPR